jgi:DNA-binding NtrC family response regulator
MKHRVLIVDDDAERRVLLGRVLADEYETYGVGGVNEALATIGEEGFAAAVVDYNLPPGGSGLEILQALRDTSPSTFRVLYSVYVSEGMRMDAMRLAGVHAVISSWEQTFLVEMRETLARLLSPVVVGSSWFGGPWVAHAPTSAAFLDELRAAAESTRRVFLYGDPGTGKTLASGLLRTMRAEWRERGVPPGPESSEGPHVAMIHVPTLRERLADLPALAEILLARLGPGHAHRLAPGALDSLLERPWRGNVRELFDVLTSAARVADPGGRIEVVHLPTSSEPALNPSQRAKYKGQRDCLLLQLRTAGTVSGAARLEGTSRPNYIRLMHRLGIESADGISYKPGSDDDAELAGDARDQVRVRDE